MTYDYQCNSCKLKFTIEKSISAPSPTDCPNCEAQNSVERIFEPTPTHFKGSGFYCTDYKKKDSK